MVLAMGVVPGVMVRGESDTWLGVMELAMGVLPDVMYQVSMATGWGSWYLLGVVLGVMVPGECGI